MEYYSQYEKELQEGGYKDPEVEETWMDNRRTLAEKYPVSLERDKNGVFDVEEMVQVLNHQK
uniref:Uncharacterized protein n=1 Tax=Romanomermis culicivorax TaxID=13658 RepID=A0A915HSI2_ROMCU